MVRRNNIRLLNKAELTEFNRRYRFEINDEEVIVINKNYNRQTKHSRQHSFSILALKLRRITISVEAMNIYAELKSDDISLIDVQQAINVLTVMYQPITKEQVEKVLKGKTHLVYA